MKKRIIALMLVLVMIRIPYLNVKAAEPSDISIATDSDAETDENDTYYECESNLTDDLYLDAITEGTCGYIDTGDRIDYYVPMDDSQLLYSNEIPAQYDSRDYGVITSVKNQNPYGTCWAFAALASGEASMLSAGITSDVDLSEYHLAYFFFHYVNDPLGNLVDDKTYINSSVDSNYLTIGGNNYFTMFALSSWRGAADESVAKYENAEPTSTLDDSLAFNDMAHLQNTYIVSVQNSDEVKKLIMEYGAVASGIYMDTAYYNSSTCGYYENTTTSSNHAITIVGWDDTYSIDNFKSTRKPSSPGAWLVRNSWGSSIPYLWVSYEDLSISNQDAFAFVMEKSDNYDNNYQYDGTYVSAYGRMPNGNSVANVFTAKASEQEEIKAASIALRSDNVSYSLQIYKNPQSGNPASGESMLDTPVTGQTTYAGYYTITLPQALKVNKGDTFSVVFTLTDVDSSGGTVEYYIDQSSVFSDSLIQFNSHTEEGQSYYLYQGYPMDLGTGSYESCARIKAFTDNVEIVNPDTPENPDTPVQPDEQTISISSCTVTAIQEQYYTGTSIIPAISINYNGTVLQQGVDYNVTYTNNINPGTATVTISGIGKYNGTKTMTFTILAKKNATTIYNGVDYSAVYDYNYYVSRNQDVWNAYGLDDVATLRHFVLYGMKECRQGISSFDVKSYLYQYADLRRAYGTNYPSYYTHYIKYGKREGRIGTGTTKMMNPITVYNGVDYSAVYDYDYYTNKYSDVKKLYDLDDAGALAHFVNCGMAEKRQACASFDVISYANRYADLRHAYKNDMAKYYNHYIKYGKRENRVAVGDCSITGYQTIYNGVDYAAVYDYGYYITHNADVYRAYGYDETAVLKHFVTYGMSEGRQASAGFNVRNYKARYVDLQKAYGNNLKSYYMHFIRYGKNENRNGV